MTRVERSALMPFAPAQLLALVQDVARYPEFMPGCVAATIEAAEGDLIRAGLSFRLAGLTESFITENRTLAADDGSRSVQMRLVRGPFKSLVGQWRFQPLGEAACKVSLTVDLDWGAWSLGRLLMPQLDRAIGNVMQAFKSRAEQSYGSADATA